MEEVKKTYSEKIDKTLSVLKEDLNTVRAGRANPAILDKITAEYYGTPTPLKSLANISVPDPRTLMIAPFDPSCISTITTSPIHTSTYTIVKITLITSTFTPPEKASIFTTY